MSQLWRVMPRESFIRRFGQLELHIRISPYTRFCSISIAPASGITRFHLLCCLTLVTIIRLTYAHSNTQPSQEFPYFGHVSNVHSKFQDNYMPGSNSPSTKDGGAESEDASSLFIHFTGEDGNDTSTQRSIRSHVMRNCHRKKRENRVRFLSRAANGQRLPTLTARVLARRNKSLQPQEASVLMSTAPTSPEETTTISAPIKPITTKKVPLTNAITSPPSDSTFISQIDGLDPFSTLPIKPTPRTHMILHNST